MSAIFQLIVDAIDHLSFVQFEGIVRFRGGNISTSNGSSTSHSESVKSLEDGMIIILESHYNINSS